MRNAHKAVVALAAAVASAAASAYGIADGYSDHAPILAVLPR
ncbi:hypothetical protein [Flindersiella endophytica]